jgi:adenosylcobinamide-phosphate guanylyltransferase
MAGGEGSRLNRGEKPLVNIGGSPMIAHVIRAFSSYGCSIVVVASHKTPMTRNWCRVTGIDIISADGRGYIEDMVNAVTTLGETKSLFVSVSDLPCINGTVIKTIDSAYRRSGKDACSAWVPLSLVKNPRETRYTDVVEGTQACPAGINILRGDLIDQSQDEFRLLLSEPRLAFNVNTREDLALADLFLKDSPI